MGTIGASASRAMRTAPSGSVVGSPKKSICLPLWKKSRSVTKTAISPRLTAEMARRTPEGVASTKFIPRFPRRYVTASKRPRAVVRAVTTVSL
jgi:hypothetical protein